MSVQYNLIAMNGKGNITVVVDGEMLVASDEHPNWERIVTGAVAGDPEVATLFDQTVEVAKKFESLSDSGRITVANGRVYLDGDEVNSTLTEHILRALEADEDFAPLVHFYENLLANPQPESREMLYNFLDTHRFTITEDGCFIGYKGVRKDENGNFTSVHAGPAIVNGEEVNGYVPNPLGAVVEVARSYVAFDPSEACSTGLHVGTYNYASSFAGHLLTVKVNPRDVVSVPADHGNAKVRVCRYVVLEVNEGEQHEVPVYRSAFDDDDEEDCFYCDYCGEDDHDSEDCRYVDDLVSGEFEDDEDESDDSGGYGVGIAF